ncbi:MAG TPA: C25 family cysteine peptidase [Pyrinomonadaceae bacterium]
MKKAISAVLLASLSVLSAIPIHGQKGRAVGLRKQQQQLTSTASTRFSEVFAYTDGRGVLLKWQMAAEIENIGFHVYRVGKGGMEVVSQANVVGGAALHAREVPSYGETYSFFDRNGTGDSAYFVESISLNGTNTRTEHVYPISVPDLRAVDGKTAEEFAADTDDATQLETSVPTYTKEIVTEMQENQLVPDPVTHRIVISTPGAVRIGVKTEGLYRVPRTQLEAAGFNVNADPTFWQLYVEGVEQAMIVGNNADYIEFYGKGLDTPETDIRQYYLINGASPGRRIETRVAHPNTSTVVTRSYLQTFVKKERNNFIDDVQNGELENYFGRGFGAVQTTMNFNLSGVDFATAASALHLRFQGYSVGTHLVEIILNDVALPSASGPEGSFSFSTSISIATSLLREGANTIKFRAIGPAGDFVFFDSMHIDFSRKYVADQNRVSFYTQNYRKARLEGFTSADVRVFDLTYDGSPMLMTNLNFQQIGATFGVDMPPARGRSFYAVENSAVLAPQSVTSNNPELVGGSTNGAQLVIITHKDFMTEAQAWATYRTGQGFTAKVIEVSELYDEFNYGALSSSSIRSFLQYAHANWQTPPQYVLLIGDASADSRNYENQGYWNMIPPKMVSAVYSETASDEALADFNNDGLAEIAIGRIASRTAAGVTTVFNKVVHWEATVTDPLSRGAIFAYDHNDGWDFDGMSLRLRNQLPVSMPVTMIYRGQPNANTTLINEMNAGKLVINYSGHGTTGSWGGSPVFFNINSVPTLADNPNSPALYTMLTCLNGAYHYLHNESFAEVLTKANNRGAVAAWASTGKTTPDIQEMMASRFFLKLGQGDIPRLGDLIKDAKTAIVLGTDVRLSWALIGDPMLKVR